MAQQNEAQSKAVAAQQQGEPVGVDATKVIRQLTKEAGESALTIAMLRVQVADLTDQLAQRP